MLFIKIVNINYTMLYHLKYLLILSKDLDFDQHVIVCFDIDGIVDYHC